MAPGVIEFKRPSWRGIAPLAVLLVAVLFSAPGTALARTSDENAVLTALAAQVLAPPSPVLGTDRVNHLAYEIRLVNTAPQDATINEVQPRSNGKPFGPALSGAALASMLKIGDGQGGGTTIPAGGSALLFMDVTYAHGAKAPRRLRHGFSVTLTDPGNPALSQDNSFAGVPTRVLRTPPFVVEPPLRGDGWVVANGCCDPINAHRGAALGINGTTHLAQRYAIDFVQINGAGTLFNGPVNELSSYAYFGAPIRAATGGRVVRVRDGEPEQVPGSLPVGQTVNTADGNYVVVKADREHYAFYAHMQPGSIRVEVGDRIRAGRLLGLLGNTGNTDGPHLHFHVMDGPSPLQSNGVPFVYDRFRNQGWMSNGDDLQAGAVAQIDPAVRGGAFRRAMPLGFDVLDFGR